MNAAASLHYVAMARLAGEMEANRERGRFGPVRHADLVTSMQDHRAGLSIACGTPVDLIDRQGYDLSRSGGAA
jgi:hypothetical protein